MVCVINLNEKRPNPVAFSVIHHHSYKAATRVAFAWYPSLVWALQCIISMSTGPQKSPYT